MLSYPIVMHIIHGYVAFFPYSGTNTMVGTVSQSETVIMIVYTMICITIGVFLLRGHDKDNTEVLEGTMEESLIILCFSFFLQLGLEKK